MEWLVWTSPVENAEDVLSLCLLKQPAIQLSLLNTGDALKVRLYHCATFLPNEIPWKSLSSQNNFFFKQTELVTVNKNLQTPPKIQRQIWNTPGGVTHLVKIVTYLFVLFLLGLAISSSLYKSLWGLVWLSNSKTNKTNLMNSLREATRNMAILKTFFSLVPHFALVLCTLNSQHTLHSYHAM